MNCRDVQRLGEWPSEDGPAGRHLATCVSCREELTAQVRLRAKLRSAFEHAAVLEPTSGLALRLRERLAGGAVGEPPRTTVPRHWLVLAATVAVMAGLLAATLLKRSEPAADRFAGDAVGDHWNCALRYRLIRRPVPLDEAARRYDPAFRLFLDQPPETIATRTGDATVTERHSCAFDARRFAHVILRYQGHVVSLLLTGRDADSGNDWTAVSVGGFTVLTAPGADHVLMLVSDLSRDDLQPLALVVSNLFVPQLQTADRREFTQCVRDSWRLLPPLLHGRAVPAANLSLVSRCLQRSTIQSPC